MSNADAAEKPVATAEPAAPAEPTGTADAAAKVEAAPKKKPTAGLLMRGLQAIERQKSNTSKRPAPKPVNVNAEGPRPVPVDKVALEVSKEAASTSVPTPARVPSIVKAERPKTVATNSAARLLGMSLKGVDSKPVVRKAAGIAGGFLKRSMKASVLGSALRAATMPAATPRQRPVPVRRVPPVQRIAQAQERARFVTSALRSPKSRAVGRALAQAVGAAGGAAPRLRVTAAPKARPVSRGVARFGGIAGALLPVKREDSDNEADKQPRRKPARITITTVKQELDDDKARSRTKPKLVSASGFGYGHAGDDSEEEPPKAAKSNGQVKRPLIVSRPARARQDARGSNLAGFLQRHLASAKADLKVQSTGEAGTLKVKLEEAPSARWEPKDSPGPAQESESEEVASPPRKRAKCEPSESSQDREDLAERTAKEMKALQGRLEVHYSSMKNYIRTRAEPTIFWLPAKHNSRTKAELEETRSAISQKIASLKVHLQATAADEDSNSGSDEE